MVTVVYIDVLLVVNAVVNYFLLLMTAFFAKERKRRGRIALAAFGGGLFSFAILLPPQPFAVSLLIRAAGAGAMAAVAFGVRPARRWGRCTAYLFVAGAVLAGGLYALAEARPGALYVRNQSIYFDLSPLTLIAATLGVYLLLCAVELLFRRPRDVPDKCDALVTTSCGSARVLLLPDTGDRLRDAVTGRSVVVLRRGLAPQLLDAVSLAALYAFEAGERSAEAFAALRSFSLIPFSTVAGGGLLLGFPAQSVTVTSRRRAVTLERPVIAFADDALLCGADGLAAAEDLLAEVGACRV